MFRIVSHVALFRIEFRQNSEIFRRFFRNSRQIFRLFRHFLKDFRQSNEQKNPNKKAPSQQRDDAYARGSTLLPSRNEAIRSSRSVNVLINVSELASLKLQGSKIWVVLGSLQPRLPSLQVGAQISCPFQSFNCLITSIVYA